MDDRLMEDLVGAARKRWIMLLVGFGLLAVLFAFAGMIRTPGARKNPYTVIASRALAVAGALLLTRILLLTHEDGLPVFLIEASALGGPELEDALGIIEKRYDLVPMPDVLEFIRDQRYVPRKAAAVVVRIESRGKLGEVGAALRGAGEPPVTLLLGPSAAAGTGGGEETGDLPAGVALAVEATSGQAPDEDTAASVLKALSDEVRAATGRRAGYALLHGGEGLVLGKVARAAGVEAFFGGDGLNRYGDRGNRVRLADITAMLAPGVKTKARLSAFTAMYRGNYFAYPAWAYMDVAAPLPPRGQGG